jgi:hypothetical protein
VRILGRKKVAYKHMQELADRLGASTKYEARNEYEWLCWDCIPGDAVVNIYDEVEEISDYEAF